MTIYSPMERPANADVVDSILRKLSRFDFLVAGIYPNYVYEEITDEISERRRLFETVKKREGYVEGMGEDEKGGRFKRDFFFGSPNEMTQFFTPPYPEEIIVYFDPGAWKDREDFTDTCRMRKGGIYEMGYLIKLDNRGCYYIAKQPRHEELSIEGIGPVHFGFKDGLPIPCIDHKPYVEICSQRFTEVRRVVDEAGLPVNIEEDKATRIMRELREKRGQD